MKNTYAVTVKLGHVGKNKYIVKVLPIIANNAKEAAKIARVTPRVKHHAKDAILDVNKIEETMYIELEENYNNDPYFSCKNIQEQRNRCKDIEKDIYNMEDEDIDIQKRKEERIEKIKYNNKKYKIMDYEYQQMIHNYNSTMECY